MIELTDEEIAKRVQEGDADTFGLLVERYETKMLRYARKFLFNREDAADLVQEVFIKAYVNIRGFDVKRKFSPWLYRIAHNEYINALKKRRQKPITFFATDTLLPHPEAKETADRLVQDAELRESLERGLDKLPAKYRELMVLYYYEELRYEEIAEVLHLPVATVGVRLLRGRVALKKLYEEKIKAKEYA